MKCFIKKHIRAEASALRCGRGQVTTCGVFIPPGETDKGRVIFQGKKISDISPFPSCLAKPRKSIRVLQEIGRVLEKKKLT